MNRNCIALCSFLGIVILLLAIGVCRLMDYQFKPNTNIVITEYKSGDLPIGTPILLYFIADDGTIYSESAIKTDYAGVLPYSFNGSSVDSTPITGYFCWTKLDTELIIAIEATK